MGRTALEVLCAVLFGAAVASIWFRTAEATTTYHPPQEALQPNGYNRFPDGISIGNPVLGIGCLGWSEPDQCFFIDTNCDYVKDASERTMCECECCLSGETTTTTTPVSTTTTSTEEGATTTTSTSLASTTSLATTTSTTSSTTSTTVAVEAFAEGACYTLLGARPEHDLLFPWIAPAAQEITGMGCHCEGQCVAPIATLQVIDGDGNVITPASTMTCSTLNNATVFVAVGGMESDRFLVEGERFGIRVTNSPASYDRVTVCVQF